MLDRCGFGGVGVGKVVRVDGGGGVIVVVVVVMVEGGVDC